MPGAGAMGSGIALATLYAEHEVTLTDSSLEALKRAREYVAGQLSRKGLSERGKRLNPSQDIGAMSGSEIVVEAAPDELGRVMMAPT
ncbi:MAG: 3-hydroxyacyl-CoA dehydrogenase NAD-binding domain-containing protein [Anaerolineales bacterium]